VKRLILWLFNDIFQLYYTYSILDRNVVAGDGVKLMEYEALKGLFKVQFLEFSVNY
jgi:hypothetical protein